MEQTTVNYMGKECLGLVLAESAKHKLIHFKSDSSGSLALFEETDAQNRDEPLLSFVKDSKLFTGSLIDIETFDFDRYFPIWVAEKLKLYAAFKEAIKGAEGELQQSIFMDYNLEIPIGEQTKLLYNQEIVFLRVLFG
ncbi:MAG: hypothetical protein LBD73_08025 [Deferribacteraceae bacterium]|jgi:hypothetical protein|nr:hypothetical protein [Deferribacteraceae bacterium]